MKEYKSTKESEEIITYLKYLNRLSKTIRNLKLSKVLNNTLFDINKELKRIFKENFKI
jgi:hypothetical protein